MKRFITQGLVVLLLAVSATGAAQVTERVSLDLNKTAIRPALAELFKGRSNFVLSTDVDGDVTISVKNVPFDTVVRYLLIQVDATYRIDDSVYAIMRKVSPTFDTDPKRAKDDRVAIHIENVDAQAAIRSLFHSAMPTRKFEIAPELGGKITVSRAFNSPEEALSWLADKLHASISLEAGIYMIRPKG